MLRLIVFWGGVGVLLMEPGFEITAAYSLDAVIDVEGDGLVVLSVDAGSDPSNGDLILFGSLLDGEDVVAGFGGSFGFELCAKGIHGSGHECHAYEILASW